MCLCAHHEVGIYKRESNYVTLSGCTEFHELDEILFSYNIALSPNVIVRVISWNVNPGSGQTDGEGVERTWSKMNSCTSCTKVMGPSHHHNILDDLLGSHNWLKCCGHGVCLVKKAKLAAEQCWLQSQSHIELMQALPDPHVVSKWMAEVEAWEHDCSRMNLYYVTFKHVSEADVKLAIVQEELENVAKGVPELDELTSPGGFLALAFYIEEEQRRMRLAVKDATSSNTTAKSLDVGNKRRHILKLMKQLCNVQTSYMPCLLQILGRNKQAQVLPEELKLWLPSDLDSRMQKGGCLGDVVGKEQWLREGQCADALSDICASLQTTNVLQSNHSSKPTGQKHFGTSEMKVQHGHCQVPDTRWQIKKGHSKKKQKEVLVKPGDGKKVTSWIWRVEGALADGDEGMAEVGLEYFAKEWESCMESHVNLDPALAEGLRAYMLKQADYVCCCLASHFEELWAGKKELPEEEVEDEGEDEGGDPGNAARLDNTEGQATLSGLGDPDDA
ncbi:hypothetical protein EV421DRAFT_1935707 [Armillaria borealis]|uniref:Uncharacterized protein n=1 Tax=Armillaria borealis TaxID=47425 RepID=A0AA39IV33_9AGAR|nr:hypothetical protein EV421DRAFT_1935707 [Armillaria borealis]